MGEPPHRAGPKGQVSRLDSRLRRKRSSWEFRPSCSAGGPTCGKPSGKPQRNPRGLELPNRSSIPTSPSPARSAFRPRTLNQLFESEQPGRRDRSRNKLEYLELRTNREQRPCPGCPVPAGGAQLPRHGSPRQRGSGERHRRLPQRAGPGEVARQEHPRRGSLRGDRDAAVSRRA